MDDHQLEAQVGAAGAYEDLFVPALFRQWVPLLIDAAHVKPGSRVLDVACGTGILARGIAEVVGPSGAVYGIDALPGMLAVARRLAPAIDWRDASAEALPFPDGAFDVVVSQFGLMFFSDRLQSLREMLRVLAGGGQLAVAVWDSVDNNPAYADEVDLVQRMAGEEAADALRAPFVLGDANGMRYLAELAGVSDPGVVTREGKARFPSIGALIEADLRGWLPVMGVHLDEDTIAGILDEAETALAHYVNAQGEAEFDVSAHILSGSKA